MKVRFLDLSVHDEEEKHKLTQAFCNILDSGKIILGPQVNDFEARIAEYCSRKCAIGVGSGTDALILSIKALNLPENSEIITTPLSWVASANAIVLSGHRPVFADIDSTLNLDPASIIPLINSKTAAILSVDFAGQPCDYKALGSICKSYGIKLIQDSSQALGSVHEIGPSGSHGDISAISHNSMKTLAAIGEAGSITFNDPSLFSYIETLRYAGTVNREDCVIASTNSRMDTLQAAFLNIRLDSLEEIIISRNKHAQLYNKHLHESIIRPVISPFTTRHAFYTYQIQHKNRDRLSSYLLENGIETKIQHKLLIHRQQFYNNRFEHSCKKAEVIAKNTLCLPIHEKLSPDQVAFVIETVNACCARVL